MCGGLSGTCLDSSPAACAWCNGVQLDDTGKASINIFSQQYEKQKRHRSGYDTTAGTHALLLFPRRLCRTIHHSFQFGLSTSA